MSKRVFLGIIILSHLSAAYLVFTGELSEWLIVFSIYFLTGCVGLSVTYHRLLSHKSFQTYSWFRALGLFAGTIGLVGSGLAWAAVHRDHHSHTDTAKDPHSPKKGFVYAHFMSMLYTPNLFKARDLINEPTVLFFHKYYVLVNLLYASTLFFIVEPRAVIYAWLAPATLLWHGGSSINSFCHLFGYKNFRLNNNARNNPIFALLTWGEGWHNNHHRYPRNPSFRIRSWELDIGGYIARLFSRS